MSLDILNYVNNFKNIDTIILDNTINFSKYSELSIFSMNIRSIKLHIIDELAIYLDSNNVKFDVIILSETWLGYDICDVFNKYFVNVGAGIENNIKSNGFVDKPC